MNFFRNDGPHINLPKYRTGDEHRIKDLGVTLVRLNLITTTSTLAVPIETIDKLVGVGLRVVLDFHPSDGKVWHDAKKYFNELLPANRLLADAALRWNEDDVAIQIGVNEARFGNDEVWDRLSLACYREARFRNKKTWLVWPTGQMNDPDWFGEPLFKGYKPFKLPIREIATDDDRICVPMHYYRPIDYTHGMRTWPPAAGQGFSFKDWANMGQHIAGYKTWTTNNNVKPWIAEAGYKAFDGCNRVEWFRELKSHADENDIGIAWWAWVEQFLINPLRPNADDAEVKAVIFPGAK
jgi:hypothetical protein